VSTVRLAD